MIKPQCDATPSVRISSGNPLSLFLDYIQFQHIEVIEIVVLSSEKKKVPLALCAMQHQTFTLALDLSYSIRTLEF
jgi:hypothetical protein